MRYWAVLLVLALGDVAGAQDPVEVTERKQLAGGTYLQVTDDGRGMQVDSTWWQFKPGGSLTRRLKRVAVRETGPRVRTVSATSRWYIADGVGRRQGERLLCVRWSDKDPVPDCHRAQRYDRPEGVYVVWGGFRLHRT